MSNKPIISIIAAIGARTRALGRDNKLLWRIPDDLKRFRAITKGHPVIMGRKTHESIGKPLPERLNIVITRNPNYEAEGCVVAPSLERALEKAREYEKTRLRQCSGAGSEIFVIGGGQIYKQAFPYAQRLYLTIVEDDKEGDVFFPKYSEFKNMTFKEDHVFKGLKYSFVDLEK